MEARTAGRTAGCEAWNTRACHSGRVSAGNHHVGRQPGKGEGDTVTRNCMYPGEPGLSSGFLGGTTGTFRTIPLTCEMSGVSGSWQPPVTVTAKVTPG